MFTIDQIKEAHSKVKSGADFPKYIQDLKTIGITSYETYVCDGRAVYYGEDNFVVSGKPKYPTITINKTSSADKLKHALSIHQNGQTDYLTFCIQAAEAGVEKWKTQILEMTVTYLDIKENKLIIEPIQLP